MLFLEKLKNLICENDALFHSNDILIKKHVHTNEVYKMLCLNVIKRKLYNTN